VKRRLLPIALIAMLIATSVAATAAAMPVRDYAASLERIAALLDRGNLEAARAEAKAVAGSKVTSDAGTFAADDSLLLTIANAKSIDVQLQARIRATVDALRANTPAAAPKGDPKLLESLTRSQEVAELEAGGDVPIPDASWHPWVRAAARAFWKAWRSVRDLVGDFLDWILDFWPSARPGESGATAGMRWLIGGLLALIVAIIVVLAVQVVRRSRRKAPAEIASSAPAASRRDEDPLSRGANEWERYAAQLAAAGRVREAIRAWYHAVLVTLYGAGILHFRKGRTNWEYVAALAPSLPWRSGFIGLTRLFEHEWYGAHHSTDEALGTCSRTAREILDAVRGGSA
jgi:hypothetical protein